MIYTDLLKEILEKANGIKAECSAEALCASHVAVAVADFCNTRYTGFAFSPYHYPRFEDERLRYLFAKEIRLASYFRMRLRHNTKDKVQEEAFDITRCEEIASVRGASILSADVVFLCALKDLHPTYKSNVKTVTGSESILALLQDTDKNIYDYVIEKIDLIRCDLKKKSDEAMAIRDWKPAAKFTEPETLGAAFFEKIEKNISGNVITLKFAKFFGSTDLKVSIHEAQNAYYIHDNGCAIRHLSKQVADKQKLARILKRVCHPQWIVNKRMTGSFTNALGFFLYLQGLIFVAHGDLYYTKANSLLVCKEKGYAYVDAKKAEPLEHTALLEMLKNGISFDYDENKGLYYWLDMRYSLGSGRASYQLETLENGQIRISDKKKSMLEGALFEQFYWNHDDPSVYKNYISGVASRFGAEFDGKDVSLTCKTEHIFKAMFNFFNLSILLSEFGRHIDPPKIRTKG